MGLFDQFPYTNFHELNLDWLLNMVKELNSTIENFVTLNTIKYADPIQWNITAQYETNTVVVDPNTGTAYLSTQPVPSGVDLSNTDYWTIIFDLSEIIGNINSNLTLHDAGTSSTATFASSIGDWLLWNNKLYEVISSITIGSAYVENVNVKQITVEKMNEVIYYPNDKKLSINGKINDYSQIVTSGDYHVYTPNIETISIEHT